MKLNLDPTRRFLDRLTVVICSPAFDKWESEDAKPSKVVDADAGRGRRVGDGRSKVTAVDASSSVDTVSVGLGFHLAVELFQIKNLKM